MTLYLTIVEKSTVTAVCMDFVFAKLQDSLSPKTKKGKMGANNNKKKELCNMI